MVSVKCIQFVSAQVYKCLYTPYSSARDADTGYLLEYTPFFLWRQSAILRYIQLIIPSVCAMRL